MWFPMVIAIALVTLAVAGYLYVSQKDKPIDDNSRYMMVYEDGLFDLFFGLMLVAGGILLDVYAGMIGILFAVLYPFLLSAKAYITKPRLDPAELPLDVAKRRQLSMFLVLGLTLLVGVLVFLVSAANIAWVRGWLDQYFMPTLVFIAAGALALWAYRTDVQRLYLYAAFVLAAYVASFWLMLAFPIYVVAIGIGVTLVGLFTMARFIQAHPKLAASG